MRVKIIGIHPTDCYFDAVGLAIPKQRLDYMHISQAQMLQVISKQLEDSHWKTVELLTFDNQEKQVTIYMR